jgi:hypothetical protein
MSRMKNVFAGHVDPVRPHRLIAVTAGTPRSLRPRLDVDAEEAVDLIIDAQDVHVGQAHQKLTHARRVCFHGGSPVCWR